MKPDDLTIILNWTYFGYVSKAHCEMKIKNLKLYELIECKIVWQTILFKPYHEYQACLKLDIIDANSTLTIVDGNVALWCFDSYVNIELYPIKSVYFSLIQTQLTLCVLQLTIVNRENQSPYLNFCQYEGAGTHWCDEPQRD